MGKTLLLADDSVTIQKVVGISFASQDIAIVTVDNGDDAIAKASELRPDIILADVVMPGKSGYEVCEAVKTDPALAHIPVLLLTGTFEAFDEEQAERSGAAGHVAKPFEAQTLVERVQELLAQAPAAAAAAAPSAPPTEATPPAPDESFDFFDDTLDDVAPAPPAVAMPAAADVGGESLDLDAPDAFAFGDDDLSPTADPVLDAPAMTPDATIAMMPEVPDTPDATVLDPSVLEGDTLGGEDPFAFDFDGDDPDTTASGLGDSRVADAALLDPDMDSGLAVSSSDLIDPIPESAPATPVEAPIARAVDPAMGPPSPEPVASVSDADLFVDAPDAAEVEPLLETEPLDADEAVVEAELEAEPMGDEPPILAEAIAVPEPSPIPQAPAAEPVAAMPEVAPVPEPAALPPPLPEAPLAAPEPFAVSEPEVPVAEPFAAAEPLDAEPEPGSVPATMSPDAVERLVEQVAPAMREEIHQTLERIAWESFGAVTEQLVEQALERIETIAWEVVPKLAETLIEEEIRKLKGGE
jgi:CheY-like chemotaxis protein